MTMKTLLLLCSLLATLAIPVTDVKDVSLIKPMLDDGPGEADLAGEATGEDGSGEVGSGEPPKPPTEKEMQMMVMDPHAEQTLIFRRAARWVRRTASSGVRAVARTAGDIGGALGLDPIIEAAKKAYNALKNAACSGANLISGGRACKPVCFSVNLPKISLKCSRMVHGAMLNEANLLATPTDPQRLAEIASFNNFTDNYEMLSADRKPDYVVSEGVTTHISHEAFLLAAGHTSKSSHTNAQNSNKQAKSNTDRLAKLKKTVKEHCSISMNTELSADPYFKLCAEPMKLATGFASAALQGAAWCEWTVDVEVKVTVQGTCNKPFEVAESLKESKTNVYVTALVEAGYALNFEAGFAGKVTATFRAKVWGHTKDASKNKVTLYYPTFHTQLDSSANARASFDLTATAALGPKFCYRGVCSPSVDLASVSSSVSAETKGAICLKKGVQYNLAAAAVLNIDLSIAMGLKANLGVSGGFCGLNFDIGTSLGYTYAKSLMSFAYDVGGSTGSASECLALVPQGKQFSGNKCADKNTIENCNYWAVTMNYCTTGKYTYWMSINCKASCGKC